MLYEKPKDIRYVDMCIYIDENVYRKDLTEDEDETIFKYLCILVEMLAKKQSFFKSQKQYEDFSIYVATSVFMRLKNKKQFEIDDKGNYKLKQIKSVLNYLKAILYPRKVNFEQMTYSQVDTIYEEEITDCTSGYTFSNQLSDITYELNLCEYISCLSDIIGTIRYFLKDIPYYSDKVVWNNIYISCMLTFLNSITLSKNNIHRLRRNDLKKELQYYQIDEMYEKESNKVILYHLDESMFNYIHVLTKQIKNIMCKDLSEIIHEEVSVGSNQVAMMREELMREELED